MDDIFCKIVAGEIPAQRVLEDTDWIAINDIHPKAPVHVLIIPKKHIPGITGIKTADATLAGTLLFAVRKVAEKIGIDKTGFRVIINHGEHGGQEVPHLHIHVLGGKTIGPMVHN